MLTKKELRLLDSQEGPLGGAPLFESVWREERELAEAFVRFCDEHFPGAFVAWDGRLNPHQRRDYFVSMVAELEATVCAADRDPIDSFLEALPDAEATRAVHLVKAALGTEKVAVRRKAKAAAPDRGALRAIHQPLDALWAAYDDERPYDREDLAALHRALIACEPPPIDAKDLRDYVDQAATCLAAKELDDRAVYALIWMLRASLPHHAPDLVAFRRWVEDPNRTQRKTCDETRKKWLARLARLEAPEREAAAVALAAAVSSPKLMAERDALCAALRGEPDGG
ncbi:MAG: hypothetical protein KF901_25395 [Myxococcales bacterium]|nr:hypothetical protein [Myxococcales bacterium]